MPRHYIRVDPGFYERKALDQRYPAGAALALVGCLCLAESQPQRGRFRDRKVLGVLLGPQARWIPYLIEHGDLIERDGLPRLYIDGWDEWQEGDVTVPERMVRLRARKARGAQAVTAADTPDVTAPVTTHRQTDSVEAEAVSGDKSGDGPPYNGGATTFMSYRPKSPRPTQAEALADIERQHAESLADAVAKARAKEKAAETAVPPAPTARPRSAAS